MFDKILIANRGEIACRVIKTARRMGIKTVAVYSEADADALHVDMADEAIAIGAAPAAESYLVIDKIVQACVDTGAQAVHPGYGFLSERAAFVEALAAKDIAFIGPTASAIEAMGDKITSKKIAHDAGVSTVPGHMDLIKDTDEAVKIASSIGYPVMLKATAGGGGKGMRIAWNEDECREGFTSAANEARASFGDDRVFIEKFVEEPRHIEIQVLADSHGNAVYLGERECSIQRRHQKVVEEAPSPFLDETTRKAMGEEAVALANAVQYQSAGTVEFIVDKHKNFYFLEMNTRLQVEHPVTEQITGLDLVEQMLRVAAGEPLTITQQDAKLKGWSVEARVYAEDPYRGFLPSIGRLRAYMPPEESETVRVDTGVYDGAEISMFYDPMIAKLVTTGPTRADAIAAQRTALNNFVIRGIGHNIPFLSALMAHPRFQAGDMTTAFIAEEYPDGFDGVPLTAPLKEAMICAAVFMRAVELSRRSQIPGQIAEPKAPQDTEWICQLADEEHRCFIMPAKEGVRVTIGSKVVDMISDWMPGQRLFRASIDGRDVQIQVETTDIGYRLLADGADMSIRLLPSHVAGLMVHMPEKTEGDTANKLLCPMPGLLVSIAVKEGDTVEAGQMLAVVEAMKMENILRAERAGVVASVKAAEGDSLAVDEVILEFEAAE